MCVSVHVRECICVSVCVSVYVCECECMCVRECMYVCECMCVSVCMCVCQRKADITHYPVSLQQPHVSVKRIAANPKRLNRS
jgi:hypothetical protein